MFGDLLKNISIIPIIQTKWDWRRLIIDDVKDEVLFISIWHSFINRPNPKNTSTRINSHQRIAV